MITSAANFINIGEPTAGRALRLPLEGGWNATGSARRTPRETTDSTGELSPMAFLVGVRVRQTPPPDAPNELAPQGSCVERLAQVGGANSWRVFLPPQGGGVFVACLECDKR